MSSLERLATASQISVDALLNIANIQAVNPQSKVYSNVVSAVADLITAKLAARDREGELKRRADRVYIPFFLEATDKYKLVSLFPQFDVQFTNPKAVSAPLARAASLLIQEYMLTLVARPEVGSVTALGFSLVATVMRNRRWLHLENVGADPVVQADLLEADRDLRNLYYFYRGKKRPAPRYLTEYVSNVGTESCNAPSNCTYNSSTTLSVHDRIDTNFRQLAIWMHNHGSRLHYLAIPYHKNMETGLEGSFSELKGYVTHDSQYVGIVFKDDGDWQMRYQRENYLELIARQRVIVFGNTYLKEYQAQVGGYRIFKITMSHGAHRDKLLPYRSWLNDGTGGDKYLLRVPRLAPGGKVWRPNDWRYQVDHHYVPVSKALIESVMELSHRVHEKQIDMAIAKRLFSKAFTYIVDNQLVRREGQLDMVNFSDAIMTVYTTSFMDKFEAGAAMSTLAPIARDAGAEGLRGPWGSFSHALSRRLIHRVRGARDKVTVPLRAWYYGGDSSRDIPLPELVQYPGYIEYHEGDVTGNPWFKGWDKLTLDRGFHSFMPGLEGSLTVPVTRPVYPDDALDGGPVRFWDKMASWRVGMSRAAEVVTSVDYVGLLAPAFSPDAIFPDSEDDADDVETQTPFVTGGTLVHGPPPVRQADRLVTYVDNQRKVVLGVRVVTADDDPRDYEMYTEAILRKMVEGHSVKSSAGTSFRYHALLVPDAEIVTRPGAVSLDPLEDMRSALEGLFPRSLMLDNSIVEHLRLHSPFQIAMKTLFAKIDVSRIEELKPERVFLPMIRGHVLPDIKETTTNVLATMVKRNANVPYNVDPQDPEEKWNTVRKALFENFYVDGAEEWLAAQSAIEFDEVAIREWCARQDVNKLKKIAEADHSFAWVEVMLNTRRLNLMLKGKLKPEMDASYETSLKMPQSIQYDSTVKSVLMLSPVIREKVKREAYVLKPNILVLQRKSFNDICNFVNQFDHRPDARGERYYIEVDQGMFDKSQTVETASLYRRHCRLFGVNEEVVKFVEVHMDDRVVSSVKAGVQIRLVEQNPSGASFTLDRNNTVTEMAVAPLLEGLRRRGNEVEFVILQGDDILIAVRGRPDVTTWEGYMSRMFNLSAKVTVRQQGNICSYDLIHRSDGSTIPLRNPVKALLGFMRLDHKDESKFEEQYMSFIDSMRYVDDLETQVVAEEVLTRRWQEIFPACGTGPMHLLLRALSTLKQDIEQFRRMFSEVAQIRYN